MNPIEIVFIDGKKQIVGVPDAWVEPFIADLLKREEVKEAVVVVQAN